MQKYPFIYTSDWAFINQAHQFNNEQGVLYRKIEGEHAIWAARVPFLPIMTASDFLHPGVKRVNIIQERQFRFIY